jgi:hypothetical protein
VFNIHLFVGSNYQQNRRVVKKKALPNGRASSLILS